MHNNRLTLIEVSRQGKSRESFHQVLISLYGHNPVTLAAMKRERVLLDSLNSQEFRLFIAVRNGEYLGRIAVGCVDEQTRGVNPPWGYMGLFEVVDDEQCFRWLLEKGLRELPQVTEVLFPYFYSTWFPYRFKLPSDESFPFNLDPLGKSNYPRLVKNYGRVSKTMQYHSTVRFDVSRMRQENEPWGKVLNDKGFVLRPFKMHHSEEELRLLFDLSHYSFQQNRYYRAISFSSFKALYEPLLPHLEVQFMSILENGDGEPVGYLFSLLHPPLASHYSDSMSGPGLTLKTACVHPQYRGLGLYRAMIYDHLTKAEHRGLEFIISAFYHPDNTSAGIVTRYDFINRYELYHISL